MKTELIPSFRLAIESSDYQKQGNIFAQMTGTKMVILDTNHGRHFANDTNKRYIFTVRLTKDGKQYTFKFGQSITEGAKEPTFYDLFACLTKCNPGDLIDFCDDYGYDETKNEIEQAYKAVCREYNAICRLYSEEEIEFMSEIF